MREVIVAEYDPAWEACFETLRSRIWEVVRDVAITIEHVGSTAVVGLAAKPIIDVTIVVASRDSASIAIEQLRKAGYEHGGDLGIVGREAFHAPATVPPHHLYLCVQGSPALANHLGVRNYLRDHPEVARAYGTLKRRLATQFRTDMDGYVEAKTEFLTSILAEIGFTPDALSAITRENRKS